MSTAPITVPRFAQFKARGEQLTMITAYDYPFAKLADEAGVEGILVGDSMGMVVQGGPNTISVTLDEIIYHTRQAVRGVRRALVVADLPFPINHLAPAEVLRDAGRVLKETGCQAVKLEGGTEQQGVIAALAKAGIPVMGHVGLRPQAVHMLGGFRVQRDAERLLADAVAAETAGAFAVVVECVPAPLAAQITQTLKIPVIGIGAGSGCDGQILVLHDVLGLSDAAPRFAKQYAPLAQLVKEALASYRDDVRERRFPASEHEFT